MHMSFQVSTCACCNLTVATLSRKQDNEVMRVARYVNWLSASFALWSKVLGQPGQITQSLLLDEIRLTYGLLTFWSLDASLQKLERQL